jgi:predicted TIM-barrel fold metal-dependent hydrolase
MTMIVDTHMHVCYPELLSEDIAGPLKHKGQWEKTLFLLSPSGAAETMEAAGVDRGVIFPLSFTPPQGAWQQLNDMIAQYVQSYPNKFIGFGIVNPQDPNASVREIERMKYDLGLRGIKIHPSLQEFYPNIPEMDPVFELCEEIGFPVISHTGASLNSHPDKYSHPMLLDEIAVKHPDLKLIAAHLGRPYYQDAALLLRKHPNVYGDICANVGRTGGPLLLEWVLTWVKVYAGCLDRVLFASDYPVFDQKQMISDLRTIVQQQDETTRKAPAITAQELEAMLGGNAARLLNLEEQE